MPDLHLEVLPTRQIRVWKRLQTHAKFLNLQGYYLAGGSALALQLGHRQSVDFDFFSRKSGLGRSTQEWTQGLGRLTVRDLNPHTFHAEINGIKMSFIGAYKYPTVEPPVNAGTIKLASILDIGLMKLLALTHRATLRDYLDLAVIIRDRLPLQKLFDASKRKYGKNFNLMVPLRALVTFADLDQEVPVLLDQTLTKAWQEILREAVRKVSV